MDKQQFDKEVEELFAKCSEILVGKGREYQSTSKDGVNVFANFERCGARLDIPRETTLLIYLTKHLDSIYTFIADLKNNPNDFKKLESRLSEPINGRVFDAINYLILLNSMFNDRRKN